MEPHADGEYCLVSDVLPLADIIRELIEEIDPNGDEPTCTVKMARAALEELEKKT